MARFTKDYSLDEQDAQHRHLAFAKGQVKKAAQLDKKIGSLCGSMETLRSEIAKRNKRRPKLVSPVAKPRYDRVFSEGVVELDKQ